MEDGLIEACAQMRLTEDEQTTITLEDVVDDFADERAKLCLVGKLLTQIPYNLNHLRNSLISAWKLVKGFNVKDVGNDLFICELFTKNDKNRILREGPWNFDKQLILFEQLHGNMQPNNMILKHCVVWVRIYNLPMNCRGRAALSKIGAKLGRVVDVDCDSGECNRYGRIRVNLDVSKPIIRGTKVINPLGEQCWIPFKYERIQNFCYWCGLLDHMVADCDDKPEETEVSDWPYGPSLRATPRKRSMMGNKSGSQPRYDVSDNHTTEASPSVSGGNPVGPRRSLNLGQNDREEVDDSVSRASKEGLVQSHGNDGDTAHAGDAVDVLVQLEGLVEVDVHQAKSNGKNAVEIASTSKKGTAISGKKHSTEGLWKRKKTGRTVGIATDGSTSSKTTTKRPRSLLQGGDSDDLFSKKVRDGLMNQFEKFKISTETGSQSRRTQ
ncbi:uncharacterized protein LOC126687767 [Mercurialis annua]|uniref:uncharacterized protein LOC126687767 n=1 Tax=Mercurialis annua TaxID=3986 RepID=UPI00216080A6|nr:uncharacterized protein LOC126687767 [Mercurialis annua]